MAASELLTERRLAPEKLRHRTESSGYDFKTTADVEPLTGIIGQKRASDAIALGLEMADLGFNIFACGEVGTGRNSTTHAMIRERAKNMPTPEDWCYVHNFDTSDQPKTLRLPAGLGRQLASDMDEFVTKCREEIPKAFEGKQYEQQKSETVQQLQQKRDRMFSELQEKARELDHAVQATPAGLVAMPMRDGEPIPSEEFEKLPEEQKEDLREKGKQVEKLVRETISEGRQLEKQVAEKTQELDRRVAMFALGHLLDDLKEKYADHEAVLAFLKDVQEDILDNIELFKSREEPKAQVMGMEMPIPSPFTRYKVNPVVDHGKTGGAPVIDERNPTYYNLLGQLQYKAQFGGMVTDHTLIKAGAVQRASGGFLVLQVLDVLVNPMAWEGLKRAIRTRKVVIENLWEQQRPIPAATLRPEPIPVKVKVILVGSHGLHQLLYRMDPDFRRLFKIKADFDVEMDRTDQHLERYASFVSARCQEGELPPFDREAVARVADYGARLAGRQDRLSTCFLSVADAVFEAGHEANKAGADRVGAEHVEAALKAARYRSRMIQDKLQRLIAEDTLLIDTTDTVPGQANGLSVYDLGDYQFGKPTRITCVTSVGRAGIVNIERESKMSGSIHDKGVLIMAGYLASRFGQDKPLSLVASICFEQSYGMIEGDSASCAELYVLLSSLADVPLRQDIAITGSVNQRGQVQPIGGVNEKIEGFFEVCKAKGLTGEQGVLVPARNSQYLMLHDEVIDAVRDEQFHVWAIDTVEQGIEILTGMPAGSRGDDGQYPEKSVFGRVDRRLREMAEVLKAYATPPELEKKREESGS